MSKYVYVILPMLVGLIDRYTAAKEPSVRAVPYYNYERAIELRSGPWRAVVSPQAGGRVLELSKGDKQALWLDEKEREWQSGVKSPLSAGRFDFGPELVVAPHPTIWSGDWTGEIVADFKARLTSPRDEAAGVQLVREFHFIVVQGEKDVPGGVASGLSCSQTITNIGDKPLEVCHWGRSFSPGGGICLVPLGDRPSRFPNKYAMYEDSAIINVRNADEQIRERDGFLEILAPPRKPKLGFDSYAGWLAYVMPNDALFVKTFKTFPDRPYNEAAGLTLSVWYPTGSRIELEPIGPRESLRPGESAGFTEVWWLFDYTFPKSGEMVDLKQLRQTLEAKAFVLPPRK